MNWARPGTAGSCTSISPCTSTASRWARPGAARTWLSACPSSSPMRQNPARSAPEPCSDRAPSPTRERRTDSRASPKSARSRRSGTEAPPRRSSDSASESGSKCSMRPAGPSSAPSIIWWCRSPRPDERGTVLKLPSRHPGVVAMIAVAMSIMALSTDLVVVSLPGMARYFDVGVSQAQATLSAFIAAFGVAQLFYGPLSDRYGRRPVFLSGCAIYAIASAVCALAPSIEALIAARIVQGAGCCAFSVIGRAIVRDIHGAEGTARMLGYGSAGMSLLILFGPVLGGSLEQQLGWRASLTLL